MGAYVQSASGSSGVGATSFGVAFSTQNLASGGKIFAIVTTWGNAGQVNPTQVKTPNTTLTQLAGPYAVGTHVSVSFWIGDTAAGDVGTKPTVTATVGSSWNSVGVAIAEVSGVASGSTAAAVFDATNSNAAKENQNTASTPTSVGPYQPTTGELMLLCYGDSGASSTCTAPSGWATTLGANADGNDNAVFTYRQSDGTSFTVGFTGSASADWAQFIVALKNSSSGTNHTVTASETLGSLSESLGRVVTLPRNPTDSLSSLSETASKAAQTFNRSGGDTLAGFTEATTRKTNAPRTVADTLSPYTETATRAAQTFARSVTDTLAGYTETATKAAQTFNRAATDSLSALSETVTLVKVVIRSASDTLSSYTETANRSAQALTRSAAETLSTFTESATRAAQSFVRTVTDALSALSEVAQATGGGIHSHVVQAADTLATYAETVTRAAQAFTRSTTDALASLVETAARVVTASRAATDTLSSFSETVARKVALLRSPSDTLGTFSETVTRAAQHFTRSSTESLSSLVETVVTASKQLFNGLAGLISPSYKAAKSSPQSVQGTVNPQEQGGKA